MVGFAQRWINDLSNILVRTANALDSSVNRVQGIATLTSFFKNYLPTAGDKRIFIADAMADNGLADQLMALIEKTPKKATAVFSADLTRAEALQWREFLNIFCEDTEIFSIKRILKNKGKLKRAVGFSYADLLSRRTKIDAALRGTKLVGGDNVDTVKPLAYEITKKSDVYLTVEKENQFVSTLALNLPNFVVNDLKKPFNDIPVNQMQAKMSLRIVLGFLNHPYVKKIKKTYPLNAVLNATILNTIAVVFFNDITGKRDGLLSQMFMTTFNKLKSLFPEEPIYWPITLAASTKNLAVTDQLLSVDDAIKGFDKAYGEDSKRLYEKYKQTETGWTLKTAEEL